MPLKHILGDIPVIRILDYLLEQQGNDRTKTEITAGAKVGFAGTKYHLPQLVECGVVFETRKIGGVQLYALDVTNEMTQSLIELDAKLTEFTMKRDDDALDEEYGEPLPEPED